MATVSEQALLSALSLPPVLVAAQSSLHVFKTRFTATCGSMLDYGVQWYGLDGEEFVVQLDGQCRRKRAMLRLRADQTIPGR